MATKKVGQLIFPLPSVSVIGSGILDPGFEIRDPVSGMDKNQDLGWISGIGINIPDLHCNFTYIIFC
jgi:hypothetical protein